MPALATLAAVMLDSAEPQSLAEFYRRITGWQITYSDDQFVYLGDGPVQLGFQRVEGYQGPAWPDPHTHAHLDLNVADVDVAVKELVAAGAAVPDFQPGGADWTVLTDPEGHPLCIAAALTSDGGG